MYVLAKFAERYDADSYGQLIRRALGRKTAAGLSAVLLCYLWGSCVAYLVSKRVLGGGGAQGLMRTAQQWSVCSNRLGVASSCARLLSSWLLWQLGSASPGGVGWSGWCC